MWKVSNNNMQSSSNMYLLCILIFCISDVATKDNSNHVKVILPIVLTLVGLFITIVLSFILVFVIRKVTL